MLKSDGMGLFKHDRLESSTNTTLQPLAQNQSQTQTAGSASSNRGTHPLPVLDGNLIAEILAATRASPSWEACVMEGTSSHRKDKAPSLSPSSSSPFSVACLRVAAS